MKIKTYLCKLSEEQSGDIIQAFCDVDKSTTPDNNDENRCIILVQDTAKTREIAKRFNLEDVTPED